MSVESRIRKVDEHLEVLLNCCNSRETGTGAVEKMSIRCLAGLEACRL